LSCGGVLTRTAAFSGCLWLMLGALPVPLAAQAPPPTVFPQTIRLRGGERQDLYLNLGADGRPEVELQARLSWVGSWPDKKRVRLDIVRNATEALGSETVLQYVPGGRVLWLEAAADRCAPAGTYRANVDVSIVERGRGAVAKSEPIPLEMTVLDSWACGTGLAQRFFSPLPVALCFFFLLTSVTHSRRLSVERLAKRLQHLTWDGNGEPELAKDEIDVQGKLAEKLRPVDRVKVWLAANPLRFGRRSYQETVEIMLAGSKLEGLSVTPVAPHCWDAPEEGHLYARAKADGDIELLAVRDRNNKLSGLELSGPAHDFESGKEIRKLDLVYSSSARLRGRAAGWRLLKVQVRGSHGATSEPALGARR